MSLVTTIKLCTLFVIVVLLSACGGGGNGSGGSSGSSGSSGSANVGNSGAASYTVGGTTSGLTGTVVLQDNSGDNLTVTANGTFTFAGKLASGSAYSVTVLTHPANQGCSVAYGSGSIAQANVSNVIVSCVTNTSSTLTLALPGRSIGPANLAVIVAAGDANSLAIANYYQTARGIPAANMITVNVPGGSDTISDSNFASLKAAIDAQLPSNIQATLLTWTAPSRVVGSSCTMSITSAMAFGFNSSYCANTCATTTASAYFNSESAQPWQDFQMRPSMMLGASSVAAAQTLIDRGVSADATSPAGDGYLLRTSDSNRSVRYPDYSSLPSLWSGNSGIQLNYIDNSAGTGSNSISGKSNVLFYFTGLTSVPNLSTNTYRPGAIADSLTSYGGYLPGGNGQMPITSWLSAGLTASYGTVAEPCNYTQKFSQASVLIDQYYRGATLIEAYWKAVAEPGQGLFVGEPLAQPFRDTPGFTISGGQYVISTRAMRPNSSYTLAYRTAASNTWTTLKTFPALARAQPQVLTAPLPPSSATQIRWVGPCATDATQQCTLSTSN